MGRVKKGPYRRVRKVERSQAEVILRVRRFFEEEKSRGKSINLNSLLDRTAEATGFSRAIIAKIKTEEDIENWKYEDGEPIKYRTESQVPDNFIALVRYAVREVILEKSVNLTIDSVLKKLQSLSFGDVEQLYLFEDYEIPDSEEVAWKWSRATLHRFMTKHGFIHDDQISHYEHTKSRSDVVSMRDDYLEWINKYRELGYNIFYQDETWVSKNMAPKKIWKDTEGNSTAQQPRKPSGSGERSILSHVCSETTGLLEGCLLLFRGSKSNSNADYHTEMNWEVFSHWCETKVFPAIAKTGKNL